MRNGPGDSSSAGAVAMTSRELVSAFVSLTPTLAIPFRIAVTRVAGAVLIVAVVVASVVVVVASVVVVTIVLVVTVRLLPLLVLLLLALPFRLLPLLVVLVGVAGAEDGEAAVRVTTGSLDHQVPIRVTGAALVDRVVVGTTSNLIPADIDAISNIVAVHVGVGAAENDITDAVGALRISTIVATVAIVDVTHRIGAKDRHAAVGITAGTLHDDVAVTILRTALV